MLVDNPLQQQPYFSPNYTDFTDISDIFNTDLFAAATANPVAASASSRESSPRSPDNAFSLLTPPQSSLPSTFPDIELGGTSPFFNFNLDDEFSKPEDLLAMPSTSSIAPYDFFGAFNALSGSGGSGPSPDSATSSSLSPPSGMTGMGIDPQLVGTPATSRAMSDFGDDEDEQRRAESVEAPQEQFTIPPVKVGGHGKARKGTVQSGGVVKKLGGANTKEKENSVIAASKASLAASASSKAGSNKGDDDDEDDDDMPSEWRPPPEVFQKMTSKEKRQLRNKISARNFRVRRKEYISTLEGDIAERDRLLDAIRAELGSSQSENVALRQEIAALKKALLGGRGGSDSPMVNLPPPAPLPVQSAAAALAAANANASATPATTTTSASLLAPNTNKDLPLGSGSGARGFWGGVGLGGIGGITPVHTAIMPEWPLGGLGKPILQENLNPALNSRKTPETLSQKGQVQPVGFDGFTELNPFTLKTLDAYRMQLWGKMAAQHHVHQNQQRDQQQHLSGLANNLRPHYFTSSKHSTPALSALLSGKAAAAYPTPPTSPILAAKEPRTLSPTPAASSAAREREQAQRDAVYAALASQTLLKRLGSAFWEAFSGAPAPAGTRAWDAEKVRKVLEGKAVVRVVDVDVPPPPTPRAAPVFTPRVPARARSAPSSPVVAAASPASAASNPQPSPRQGLAERKSECSSTLCNILEESMKSLSLGRK